MQTPRRRGRAKGPEKRGGQKRITLWLSTERARLLKACAEYRGEELGAVVDRGLDAALGGFYVAHRGPRLAPIEGGETSAAG